MKKVLVASEELLSRVRSKIDISNALTIDIELVNKNIA